MNGQIPGNQFSMGAVNMPQAGGSPAVQPGFWSRALDSLGAAMKKPETAIALDALGQGFAPKNPFAGIGTMMAKSKIASGAEAAGQERSQSMFQQLLSAMTGGKEKGVSTLKTSLGEDGMLDYTVTGRDEGMGGMGGIKEPAKGLGVEMPKTLGNEDFIKKFGNIGG